MPKQRGNPNGFQRAKTRFFSKEQETYWRQTPWQPQWMLENSGSPEGKPFPIYS